MIGAELGLKRHAAQVLDPLAEFLALIVAPEELRVVEARPQHALMPAANDALGIAVEVRNRDKSGRELAVGLFHREVALVVQHHRFEHFLGQARGMPGRNRQAAASGTR